MYITIIFIDDYTLQIMSKYIRYYNTRRKILGLET